MRGVPIAAALVAAVTALKLLCLPAYRSTDFEVHRNWLAITATRPWREWYADGASPSEWTLDYPPLFAAFEWALAQAARLVDPAMLDVNNLGYASDATVLFQRLSVLLSEGLLVWATWHAAAGLPRARRLLALFLVAAHPGLVIVDHIHFQYNGVLLGLFVLATWAVARGRELPGAALFAAALAAKHIFLYAAPAFFVHLLRRRCAGGALWQGALQFATLGAVVLGVLGPVLGPFLAAGQGAQLARRLFPVSRGLCHAFWAPNFWALYAAADKALAAALPRLGLAAALRPRAGASMTGGLVGVAEFAVLPAVGSGVAALCTLAAMAPCLAALWRRPAPAAFPRAAAFCALAAFVFGYHVHEKAILMTLIPLGVVAAAGDDAAAPGEFAFLSTLGTYALFPLLYRPEEYLVKVGLLAAYSLVALPWLRDPEVWQRRAAAGGGGGAAGGAGGGAGRAKGADRAGGAEAAQGLAAANEAGGAGSSSRAAAAAALLSPGRAAYLWGLVPLELYGGWAHAWAWRGALPFLPLLLTSVYCGAGVVHCWYCMAAGYCREAGAAPLNGGAQRRAGRRRPAPPPR